MSASRQPDSSIGGPIADTIFSRATAPGHSTRAILRISGPMVPAIIAERLDHAAPASRGCAPSRFHLQDTLNLPALVLRAVAPNSYTGEDTCEILLPGNPHLLARVEAILSAIPGVRPARPGEFTARALLNGRLSLLQAEGVALRIAAANEQDLAASELLLSGRAGERYAAWCDELAELLALVEAGVDFADQEDVRAIEPADLHRRVGALVSAMSALRGAGAAGRVESAEPLVVLVGPPSAGKSTLFNALLGRRRSVTAPEPGTTRDAIIESIEWPGVDTLSPVRVRLADLPGLDASTPEHLAQSQARHALQHADVLIWCSEIGHAPAPGDQLPVRPSVLVHTKADRAGIVGSEHGPIPVCALDGRGLDRLRHAVLDALACGRQPGVTRHDVLPRHAQAIARAEGALRASMEQTEGDPAIVADGLRAALDAIGEITGAVSRDEVLGRIFSRFCIGK